MIRLDKYLADCGAGSRAAVKVYIHRGYVFVNGQVQRNEGFKVDENVDQITLNGELLTYEKYVYFMLNKPAGIVTAARDKRDTCVMDLFKEEPYKDLNPVGRLDKDTVGILLITNNGDLGHRMLSPKKHVKKTYYVKLAHEIAEEEMEKLRNGVDIGEDKPTAPAQCEHFEDGVMLTITEGKFHQVKRMFEAVGNEVIYLKRVSFGPLQLDEKNLKEGEYRRLTADEIALIEEL